MNSDSSESAAGSSDPSQAVSSEVEMTSETSTGTPASPFGGGFDLGSVMQMAQSMQEQASLAQEQLAQTDVVGSTGGGVVSVTLNGHLHLKKVQIDPQAIDVDDPSMVEDLILAAWQDAHDQVAVLQAQADPMSALLGGSGGATGAGAGLLGDLGGLFGGA